MTTYEEVREYLERVSKSGSILGLESMRLLMNELSNVQEELSIIHIAGTNGKGSTGAYLSEILTEMGFRVGRYCSPAVFTPLEVWQINGKNISKKDYVELMSQVKNACDILASKGAAYPTVFEIETAAAFCYFYKKKVDFLLLETGMGGATDATNVIQAPVASVITTISMDHMKFLGDTLTKIARMKAGIMKPDCPVFSAFQVKEVEDELIRCAKRNHSTLHFVNQNQLQFISEKPGELQFQYKNINYKTKMSGLYQMNNAALALEVITGMEWSKPQIALTDAIANTTWPGRFEIIGDSPLFILDGAHNEDAAVQLAKTVENCFTNEKITYIIGVLADKEHEKMLEIMLPYAKKVYTITPCSNRALDGKLLMEEAQKYHKDVTYCSSVELAVDLATKQQSPVLAFGSLSYLSEVKNAYNKLNR